MPADRSSPRSPRATNAVVRPLGKLADPFRDVYRARYMPMFKNPYTSQKPDITPKDPRPPALESWNLECQRLLGQGQSQVLLAKNSRHAHEMDIPALFAVKGIRRKALRQKAISWLSAPPANRDRYDRRRRKREIEQHHSHVNLERKALSLLDWNPFVTGLIDSFYDSQALYMAIEYIPGGGTLRDMLRNARGPFSIRAACFYLANILCGLDHLRNHCIAHRDIKPENILIGADGYLVLTDLGSAATSDDSVTPWKDVGTPYYMAPEMSLDSPYDPQEEPYALDIWSTGCILYEMVTGKMAFCERTTIHTYYASLEGVNWPEHPILGANLKDLVEQMLKVHSPADRIGVADVDQIFFHPWLQSMDRIRLMEKKYLVPYRPMPLDATKTWHDMPFPEQSHFPGLRFKEPDILLAHDDRFPDARE